MNLRLSYVTFLILVIAVSPLAAQEITGLWEVVNVNVGEEVMTPVAKWTRINEGGTYQSGNGWLQSEEGGWTLKGGLFATSAINGVKDEFGAFKLKVTGEEMEWRRDEEGAEVVVSLKRIEKLPKSTADNLLGLWSLESVLKNDEDISAKIDPDNKHHLYIGWDRVYRARTPQGNKATGYWHIHGHRPDVTLLPHKEGQEAETWRVSLSESDSKLLMIGISDANRGVKRSYTRLDEFPK